MADEIIELTGATVSGICPESGKPYTIAAGSAYTTPSGKVISSVGFCDGAPIAEHGVEIKPAEKAK